MSRWLDRVVAYLAPRWAFERARARSMLAYYEAARPGRFRKGRREAGSPNQAPGRDARSLREQARHLEQNLDLARGVLSVLVANTVGAAGIGIEPQPRTRDGELAEPLARDLERLLRDWAKRPEVTWELDWPGVQRLVARAWFRDGEVLAQLLSGPVRGLEHGTAVPFSLEMIEADLLPLDFSDGDRVLQGVERNAWGRPVAYHLLKRHPQDLGRVPGASDMKRVPAGRVLHLKHVDRIGQVRGVSVFAAVITRLEDLKDYEESERIAAKVAASMAAYIKKGTPDFYEAQDDTEPRELTFRPGMIFDDLMPGEEIGTIDTSRPNAQLEPHRKGQLRAAAAGVGCTYSSLAKDYDGTYSSQRQELIEGYAHYAVLASEFVSQFVRPVYERLVATAILSGAVTVPPDVDPLSVADALYVPPQMPWIDPLKEAKAWRELEGAGYASGPEIVRRRGQNPRDVLDQEARWRREAAERGLEFDLAPPAGAPTDGGANENAA